MKIKHITESIFNEAISSKQIEQHVKDALKKHMSSSEVVKNFTTIAKRAIKDILNDYGIELPVEVSVRSKPKTHYAEISVSVHNKSHEAVGISANFILNKDKLNNDMDNYFYEIRQMIVHELVHVIQTMRANYKDSISTVRRRNFQQNKSWKEYLSDKKEIEAYAINAAQELRDQNVDPDKLEKYLKNNELIRLLGNSKKSPTFTSYFDQFFNSPDKRDQKVWKRFMKRFLHHVNELLRDKENINENDSNDKMPEHVRQKFSELGEEQRGHPEMAMVRLQHQMGGGFLNVVIEHTGDLIHRMTHDMKWGSDKDGYETVREKLRKINSALNAGFGFEKQIESDLRGNAEFFDMDVEELREIRNKGLKVYAEEHSKLTPYNEVQWLANQAAISVGKQQWDKARNYLGKLEKYAQDKETWNKKATEYELDQSGNLKEYRP